MTDHPRNLLILMSDEHRRDATGFMGHPAAPTPALDRLAARGMVFDNAYTPAPICVPARAAFATGLPTHCTGHWDSAAPWSGQPRGWMHALRDAGIHTATFGKLHYKAGSDHGAVEEIAPLHVAGEGWTVSLVRDGTATFAAAHELALEVATGETETTRYDRSVSDAAVEWIASTERTKRPWAAMVSLVTPHYPLVAPADWRARIDPDLIPPPVAARDRPAHPELRRIRDFYDHDPYFDDRLMAEARLNYMALVAFMDDCMGRVLAALEASGQAEDTLVIYVSDHGEMLGDHGFWGKSVMLEGSVGIPMIAAGPGVVAGRCATTASLLDIATTALPVFGQKAATLPGADLRDLAAAPDDPNRTGFSEYHDGGSTTGAFMIRWDRWKYVHYTSERPQLFDLRTDPGERVDLGANPDFSPIRAEGLRRLREICDPDQVDAAAHADQDRRLARMGGRDAAMSSAFSHTPIPALP